MNCYVFAYGTLCNSKVRKDVLGYDVEHYPDQINGFSLHEINLGGTTYPILREVPGDPSQIEGVYFEIAEEHLVRLDAYESSAYRRKQVRTLSGKLAWVYYE